jgi:hypothetical protein
MPAVVCVLLALQWGGTTYDWNDGRIIALFVLFGVLITLFLTVQWWAQDDATVPQRIFKIRTIWSCSLYQFALGGGFFIFIYYVPIWFQAVQGVSAIESGKRTLPMLIGNMVGTTLAGIAVSIIGYFAPFMILGTILTSIGGGLLTLFDRLPVSSASWIGYQVLVGFGIGVGWQQPIVAVQAAVNMEDVPITTAILSFTQTIGGSLFVSVAQTAFSNKLVQELQTRTPIDPAVVLDNGAADLSSHIPPEYLGQVIQSYSTALVQTFIVATAMVGVSIFGACFVEWKSIKRGKGFNKSEPDNEVGDTEAAGTATAATGESKVG